MFQLSMIVASLSLLTSPHGPVAPTSRLQSSANLQITIKSEARTKRKTTTHIHGFESFNIELKKAAKFFAQRFATGSSVSKNNQGEEEVVIQGDVAEEVVSVG